MELVGGGDGRKDETDITWLRILVHECFCLGVIVPCRCAFIIHSILFFFLDCGFYKQHQAPLYLLLHSYIYLFRLCFSVCPTYLGPPNSSLTSHSFFCGPIRLMFCRGALSPVRVNCLPLVQTLFVYCKLIIYCYHFRAMLPAK